MNAYSIYKISRYLRFVIGLSQADFQGGSREKPLEALGFPLQNEAVLQTLTLHVSQL
jgi:hypothetical protein